MASEAASGVTDELVGMNLTTDTAASCSGISVESRQRKRKRKRGTESDTTKQQDLNDLKRLADAMTTLADASEEITNAVIKIMNRDASSATSIGEVMAELQCMEEIVCDLDLHWRCCHLMLYKPFREIFVGLRGHREILVDWLRHNAYNPPGFVKSPKS